MGRRSRFLVLVTGVWGAALLGIALAQAWEDPLRGLSAVAVSRGEVAPEALQAGVSLEALLGGVRERIGRAGLAAAAAPGAPRLVLDVRLFHLRAAGLYAFSLTLALEEAVQLSRAPGGTVTARTWTAGSVGTSLSGKLDEVLQAAAERLAEGFADEFALANPPP